MSQSILEPNVGFRQSRGGPYALARRFEHGALQNLTGDSGVTDYELGADSIRVRFRGGSTYLYSSIRPGQHHVDQMKRRAIAGRGLGTYISQHVREQYERKE
jgi:hypothetical protein